MNEYTVTWGGINVTAESPQAAAEIANSWIADHDSICHVYVVEDENGEEVKVDLDFPDDE